MINLKVYKNEAEDGWICKIEYMEGNAFCSRSCEAKELASAVQDIVDFIQRHNMR